MSKLSRLAIAVCISGMASSAAHATAGAVDAAPIAVEPAPIVKRDVSSLAGFYLAGRQAGITKDLSAAAGFYTAALDKDPGNTELLDRSVLLNIASGNIPKAAELSSKLLEIDANDQLALLALSVEAFRVGDLDGALAYLDTLQNLGGPLQELLGTLLEAWTKVKQGEAAAAVRLLDDLEGPSWVGAFAKVHAGLIADFAGLRSIAEDRMRLAYEDDSENIRVVDAYARTLARSDETDRAKDVIDTFEERVGAVSDVLERLRKEIESGDVASQVSDPRQGMAEALYGLGRGIGDNDSTLAASLLQLSLYLKPQSSFPAMALGNVLEGMQQHEAAIEVYRTIGKDAPLYREARMQEALNLNVLERHPEAIALLKSLLEDDPTDVQTAVALGNVYRSLEDFANAAVVYTAAIDEFDTVPAPLWTLFYYRGIALERTGDWTAAESDFREALSLSPEHPLVLNYLGYSYIDRGENLDEAVDMVRRAVQQRPDDGYIVDSLGWAYYRLGRFDEAVEQLERAVTLRPADAVINDHLGDAYWKVGRKLEATFQWAHARDSEPEPDALETILRKLEVGLDGLDAEPATKAADASDGERPVE